MTDLDEFITRYVAVWNEPDAEVRRASIPRTWSDGASLFNRVKEYHGHPGIEAAVERSYELFVARGFRFRPRDEPVEHHGAILFSWVMTAPVDDEVDSIGTQFLVLDDDGRVRLDYQFIGR